VNVGVCDEYQELTLRFMKTSGTHLLLEYTGCDADSLDDPAILEALLRRAAQEAGSGVIGVSFHRFPGRGVTGILLLEASHLSIHTWPERGYAAVDLYLCRSGYPEGVVDTIGEGIRASTVQKLVVLRGEGALRVVAAADRG
jgi:S-adenosylmethionine decarboxylase